MEIVYGDKLQAMDLPEPPCIIDGILPEGYTVMSAPRKIGKSWLALQMCLAVASGGMILGRRAVKGQALYITLEETMDMSASRMRKVIGKSLCPKDMIYCHGCKKIEDGFIEELDELIQSEGLDNLRLVVVDVLALIDGTIRKGEDVYHKDYRVGTTLKEWTRGKHMAFVAVTHVSKRRTDDPYDDAMGTGGVTGSADALIAIRKKGRKTATMSIVGRSVAETEIDMVFDECRWVVDSRDFRSSPVYDVVLDMAEDGEYKRVTSTDLIRHGNLNLKPKEVGEYLSRNAELFKGIGVEVIVKTNGKGANYYLVRKINGTAYS